MTKNYISCGLCALMLAFFTKNTVGQIDSSRQKVDSLQNKLNEEGAKSSISIYYPKTRVVASATTGAASRQFNSNQLIEIGTADFLDDAFKQELINSVNSNLVLGYHQNVTLGYFERINSPLKSYTTKDFKQGLSIYQNAFTALSFPTNTLALVLRGNAPFAGEALDLSNSQYEQWYYTGIKYHFSFPLAKKTRAYMGVGLLAGHNHTRYTLDETSLFTATDGSFVELRGGYEIQQASTNNALGVAGLGFGVDFETTFFKGNHSLRLSAEELGLMVFTRAESVSRDSSYRFEGLFVSNIEDLSDSLFQSEGDKVIEDLFFNDSENYTRLTPFKLAARYHYHLNNKYLKLVYTELNYRNLVGYTPQVQLGSFFKYGSQHSFTSALTYGGFNNLAVDFKYDWYWGNYGLSLGLTNVLGVAAPGLSGGSFGHLGLQYIW